jgi:hypothetical protein
VTGLANGTSYLFKVAASNSAGTGPFSSQVFSQLVPAFVVDSRATNWVDTSIDISVNSFVSLTASGVVNFGGVFGASRGPGGVEAGAPRDNCKFIEANTYLGGALLAKIGTAGNPFAVGSSYVNESINQSGRLYLATNDPRCAGDNLDPFRVSINVRSATPGAVLEQGTYNTLVAIPGVTNRWSRTGALVTQGKSLVITATGLLNLGAGYNNVGPDGANTINYQYCKIPGASNFRGGALVGKIGQAGTLFVIGSNYSATAAASGELYVSINDILCAGDNTGEFKVSISANR